jgi:D-aspartate ligase
MLKPAIVLSTHTMGLGVIRSLGMMGVPIVTVYYDKGDMGYVSKYVTEKIYAPHPEKAEGQFVDVLMELAKRLSGSLLIPASDETITTVSKYKKILERDYVVACTEWEITERFIDKMHTYLLAEKAGVPVPKTIVPQSLEDLERYSQAIQYPCLVKPRQSHQYFALFRRKMVRVDNFMQMVAAYRQAAGAGLEVMIQEIIPGEDTQVINYNSYFWDGKPLVEFTAQQIRKAPPKFGAPCVVLSKNIPEVNEPGRNILRAMGFYGYSCTEFKRDARDGIYKLMEVNGRHNRSTLLAVRCGLNFPWLQYQHLIQGKLPSPSHYRTGFYWISLERDLSSSVVYISKERYPISKYLQPYLRSHVFDTLDWKDIKPFVWRCLNIFRSALRALFPSVEERRGSHLGSGG